MKDYTCCCKIKSTAGKHQRLVALAYHTGNYQESRLNRSLKGGTVFESILLKSITQQRKKNTKISFKQRVRSSSSSFHCQGKHGPILSGEQASFSLKLSKERKARENCDSCHVIKAHSLPQKLPNETCEHSPVFASKCIVQMMLVGTCYPTPLLP